MTRSWRILNRKKNILLNFFNFVEQKVIKYVAQATKKIEFSFHYFTTLCHKPFLWLWFLFRGCFASFKSLSSRKQRKFIVEKLENKSIHREKLYEKSEDIQAVGKLLFLSEFLCSLHSATKACLHISFNDCYRSFLLEPFEVVTRHDGNNAYWKDITCMKNFQHYVNLNIHDLNKSCSLQQFLLFLGREKSSKSHFNNGLNPIFSWQ